MTSLRRGDADLHDDNGEHVSTPPTADGHQVLLYERRIQRHLAEHRQREMIRRVERPTEVVITDGRLGA